MTKTAGNRHLSRTALGQYLERSAPASIVVPGDPTCQIVIDPPSLQMALRTPHTGAELNLADFEHFDARVVSDGGVLWCEVLIDYRGHGHEAYLLLSDIADMIQQSGLSCQAAVKSALRTFEEILAHTRSLSPEKQIGLYGELLFLESCLKYLPPDKATQAWKGFAPHEHDFVFEGACFEIKSTTTEKRLHRIGSLEQLTPIPGATLWLVSVQLTSASSASGRTLTELVDKVREAVGSYRPALDVSLTQAGWRDRDRDSYQYPYTLRTAPAAYLVDDTFPVLSRAAIRSGCPRPELIVDASYTIDVTTLKKGSPPSPVDSFVEGSGNAD